MVLLLLGFLEFVFEKMIVVVVDGGDEYMSFLHLQANTASTLEVIVSLPPVMYSQSCLHLDLQTQMLNLRSVCLAFALCSRSAASL